MMYSSHFSNVLFVIKAVDNRAGAEEKYCFEESVSTDMKECKLGLVQSDGYYYKA